MIDELYGISTFSSARDPSVIDKSYGNITHQPICQGQSAIDKFEDEAFWPAREGSSLPNGVQRVINEVYGISTLSNDGLNVIDESPGTSTHQPICQGQIAVEVLEDETSGPPIPTIIGVQIVIDGLYGTSTHQPTFQRQMAVERLEGETSWQGSFRTRLMTITAYDDETKKLCRISIPFIGQALVQGITRGLRVGIIGRFIGTNALLAYLTVDLLVGLTTSLLGGFQEALSALCSHGLGHGSSTLVGQYAQIATSLYILSYIPFFALWVVTIGAIVTFLGFDSNIGMIAEEYVLYYLFAELVAGVHKSVRSVLNVIDMEIYATISSLGTETLNGFGLLVAVTHYPNNGGSLVLVGMVHILVELFALLMHVAIIAWRGWFDPLLGGMLGSVALLVSSRAEPFALFLMQRLLNCQNPRATKTLIGTACSLGVGEVLAYCEWQILTVFARSVSSSCCGMYSTCPSLAVQLLGSCRGGGVGHPGCIVEWSRVDHGGTFFLLFVARCLSCCRPSRMPPRFVFPSC